MALEKPTDQPTTSPTQEHKLGETEHGMLRELRAIQVNHSNAVRALMAAYLSTIAATQWGYTPEQVLTFDIDLDKNDPTVRVAVAAPAPVADQPATELPAEHEVPTTAPAPEVNVEAPAAPVEPQPQPEEPVAEPVVAEAPAEPTPAPETPEAPQA